MHLGAPQHLHRLAGPWQGAGSAPLWVLFQCQTLMSLLTECLCGYWERFGGKIIIWENHGQRVQLFCCNPQCHFDWAEAGCEGCVQLQWKRTAQIFSLSVL